MSVSSNSTSMYKVLNFAVTSAILFVVCEPVSAQEAFCVWIKNSISMMEQSARLGPPPEATFDKDFESFVLPGRMLPPGVERKSDCRLNLSKGRSVLECRYPRFKLHPNEVDSKAKALVELARSCIGDSATFNHPLSSGIKKGECSKNEAKGSAICDYSLSYGDTSKRNHLLIETEYYADRDRQNSWDASAWIRLDLCSACKD